MGPFEIRIAGLRVHWNLDWGFRVPSEIWKSFFLTFSWLFLTKLLFFLTIFNDKRLFITSIRCEKEPMLLLLRIGIKRTGQKETQERENWAFWPKRKKIYFLYRYALFDDKIIFFKFLKIYRQIVNFKVGLKKGTFFYVKKRRKKEFSLWS